MAAPQTLQRQRLTTDFGTTKRYGYVNCRNFWNCNGNTTTDDGDPQPFRLEDFQKAFRSCS